MKFELELRKFRFVVSVYALLACIAMPRFAAAQTTSQTQTQPACPPPATSTDKGTANADASEVLKAANSISNLGSIFGKKKAAQNPDQVADVAGGCDAKVNAATTDAGTGARTISAPSSGANPSSAAPTTTLSSSAAAQPTSAPAARQTQGAAAPYVPPSGAPAAFTGPLDSSKLPDISGVHLGMTLAEAKTALQKLYPGTTIVASNGMGLGPHNLSAVGRYRGAGDSTGGNEAGVDFTLPPNPQLVWHMARNTPQSHVAHNVLVAALRQKYGKEAYATGPAQAGTLNDSAIQQM